MKTIAKLCLPVNILLDEKEKSSIDIGLFTKLSEIIKCTATE